MSVIVNYELKKEECEHQCDDDVDDDGDVRQ